MLTLLHAHALALLFGASYVLSVYALPRARLGPAGQGRDNPAVIRARLLAVCASTVLSCGVVGWAVWTERKLDGIGGAIWETLDRLGLFPHRAPLLSYLLAPALYLGPLYALFLADALPGQRLWSVRGDVAPLFDSWVAIRNYWAAPLTEELVFRACVLAVYLLALGAPPGGTVTPATQTRLIFLTPLSFGLAHAHHAREAYVRGGRTRAALKQAAIGTIFQLAYTTLFGAHCAALVLRTRSFWPALASHVWCNVLGIPQLGHELRRFPQRRIQIWTAYVTGVGLYVWGMRNWTRADV